ncbi:MAG TPA: CxxC-x17-CxxC domain-containing protein [Dehalococcoidia bacterium]|nr:CxxC-x17-CxxC domain-containing protein [Dehalococcoidia bacterium]
MTAGQVVEERSCRDCGERFVVTAEERDYVARNGWTLSNRCRPCRLVARYLRDGREFTDTACSRCSRRAVVPFRPTPGRDVLCEDCLAVERQAQRGGA